MGNRTGRRTSALRRRRGPSPLVDPGADPMSGVANLFDVAMVFAVALLLAMFAASSVPELLFSDDDLTIVKNAGQEDMEIIRKKGVKLERYRMSEEKAGGAGHRLGICYRLENGDVVYVPETPSAADAGESSP